MDKGTGQRREIMSQDYYVVGIDVMAYSEKELLKQVHAQDLLDRTLATALEQHTTLKDPIWIDGGDGGYPRREWQWC
jgi:hypothetical protein